MRNIFQGKKQYNIQENQQLSPRCHPFVVWSPPSPLCHKPPEDVSKEHQVAILVSFPLTVFTRLISIPHKKPAYLQQHYWNKKNLNEE